MRIGAFSIDKKWGDFRVPWFNYYSKFCDEIEILNDDIPEGKDVYDKFSFMSPVLTKKMEEMFTRNDVVIYADIDEFIVPNPTEYGHLRDYVQKFCNYPQEEVRCTGMNVVQVMGEDKIQWNEDLLLQRRYWSPAPFYNKFNICKKPHRFLDGYINPHVPTTQADHDLILMHLKYIDLEEEVKRGKERRGYKDYNKFVDTWLEVTKKAELIPDKYKVI
jgi:hypothetical protein